MVPGKRRKAGRVVFGPLDRWLDTAGGSAMGIGKVEDVLGRDGGDMDPGEEREKKGPDKEGSDNVTGRKDLGL